MGVIPVKGSVLKWARDERRLSKAAAAKRLGYTEDEIDALENDKAKLTVGQLRLIAQKYEVTFAALLMPAPLPASTRPKVKDFRTHTGALPEYDHQMIVELESIREELEALASLQANAPELFGNRPIRRVTLEDDPESIANLERPDFRFAVARQFDLSDRNVFYTLRALIEQRGVFSYARNLGPTDNCRGFSIFDDTGGLPAVVVNSWETLYAARNFTLMHEYAHILLREAGVSDENRKDKHERFANQFAAFFLMPRSEFVIEAKRIRTDRNWDDRDIGRLATRFRVSKSAATIHLQDTGLAPATLYERMLKIWKARERKAGGVSTHPEKMVNRYGVRHIQIVLSALDQKKINQLDAFEMMGISPKFFESVRAEAKERQTAYGGGG